MRGREGNRSHENEYERRGSDTSRREGNKLQKSSTDSEDDADDNSDENANNDYDTNQSNNH